MLTLLLVSVLFSSQAFAFDFHGIKSGMKPNQVAKLFNSNESEFDHVYGDELKKYTKLADSKYWDIYFSYTDKNELWKITANIMIGRNVLEDIALKQALETKYKNHTIEKSSESGSYGTSYYYNLILIDKKLSDASIRRIKNSLMNKI